MRYLASFAIGFASLLTSCKANAPAAAAIDPAVGSVIHYASDPAPLPPVVFTPENIACPTEECLLAPPVPIVVALKNGAIIGGGRNVIQRVGADGRKQFVYGGKGDGPGEYRQAYYADVDSAGILTVLDVGPKTRRIRYDVNGKHLS